jgi:hypothetical protein
MAKNISVKNKCSDNLTYFSVSREILNRQVAKSAKIFGQSHVIFRQAQKITFLQIVVG